MGVSMAAFTTFIEQFSDVLWNSLLLFLLVGTGVYFTVRLRGVQVRRFGEGFRRVFGGFTLRGKKADAEGMSSFQALTTAIAAQVGTGNITGCATALVSGGPGALFWTWVSAFFGMATIYAEAVLAQHYKTTVNGHVTGGPAYYIRAAFKGKVGKVLATVFSVLIILALGFMGNMVQSNSIGDAFHNAFGLNRLAVGVVVAAIAAFIFLGGVQRIAAVTEKVVPIMAAFYILGCIVILVINAKALPGALAQVFVLAFEPQAMAGGIAGVTVQQSMRFGVARGLFSNEAGLGSTPHAHALAKVERPQDQGAVAILGVFVDTFVVLTLTGLVLITSGLIPQGMTGTSLTQAAFSQAFGGFGPIFIAVCMFFFAFSTIIGWYFFGQSNFKALFGEKLLPVYSIIVVAFILVGSTLKVDLVWALADLFNGLMAVPNLLALRQVGGVDEPAHDVGARVIPVVDARAPLVLRRGGQQHKAALHAVDKDVAPSVEEAHRAQRLDDQLLHLRRAAVGRLTRMDGLGDLQGRIDLLHEAAAQHVLGAGAREIEVIHR